MEENVVPLGTLLERIGQFIRRYVAITDEQLLAVCLWVAHAHALYAAEVTPYLHVTAATMRAGKTRLLEVLELIVPRPWLTGRVTAAVLPRRIDAVCPTLLLDESDATFKNASDYSERLRGVLNSGYKRSGYVSVCTGGNSWHDFSTFCPKAIAGIGTLPTTVMDRSIPIKLKRRLPSEKVLPFSPSSAGPVAALLKNALETWANAAVPKLRSVQPALQTGLNDRACEVWGPLWAIADLAGEPWASGAHFAAGRLGRRADDEEDIAVELLFNVHEVFEVEPDEDDVIASKLLLKRLTVQPEWRWATYSNGKPMTAHALAQFLKAFDIFPFDAWAKGKSVRGYRRSAFADAFQRYGVVEVRESKDASKTGRSARSGLAARQVS